MLKKHDKLGQAQANLRHMKFANSKTINEIYPEIQEITFSFLYTDPDSKEQSSDAFHKNPEHLAIFDDFDCPYRECIQGGFDLSKAVNEMFNNKKTELNGRISCQGWQDRERINQHRCLCGLEYKISIQYR